MWSAARRYIVPGSRHGLRVAVLQESGWTHVSRRLEGVGNEWASQEGCEEDGAVGKRAEEGEALRSTKIRNSSPPI